MVATCANVSTMMSDQPGIVENLNGELKGDVGFKPDPDSLHHTVHIGPPGTLNTKEVTYGEMDLQAGLSVVQFVFSIPQASLLHGVPWGFPE